MSLFIPFNHNPVDNKETTASYTVPSGKYAIVSVTLSVSAYGTVEESGTGGALSENAAVSSASDSTTVTLRLKTGEVLTKTENAASDTESTSGSAAGKATASATSTAAALVNSVEVAEIDAAAFAYGYDANGGAGIHLTATVSGTAKVHWHIAEYNNIT